MIRFLILVVLIIIALTLLGVDVRAYYDLVRGWIQGPLENYVRAIIQFVTQK